MTLIPVKIKKLHPDAKVPLHMTEQAAGCDFYSIEDVIIKPGETKKIATGVSFEIPRGFYLRIEDRSGMALRGIHKVGGIIDSDYRGELFILLQNGSTEDFKIEKHDRIAQGIFSPVSQASFSEVLELQETVRGDKGFESTGK